MRLSHREQAATRTQRVNKSASDLFGLRCCCIIALGEAGRLGLVEHRAGEGFTTPCCGIELAHREGEWGRA